MLRLTQILDAASSDGGEAAVSLTLSFADRRRSRLLTKLGDGQEVALMLPRGTILRDGDRLRGDDPGLVATVRAAPETLSVARAEDPLMLARAAYHLGNRHVSLQIGPGWLAYAHDHVLDDLMARLGLRIAVATCPFEPEAGGYGHGHAHGRADGDGHSHGDGHERE